MTHAPMLCKVNDVLGIEYPGFFWGGIPHRLPELCSEEEFIHFWAMGWNDKTNGRQSYGKYYVDPAYTIYQFAYTVAPSPVASNHIQAITEAAKNRFSSQPELNNIPF